MPFGEQRALDCSKEHTVFDNRFSIEYLKHIEFIVVSMLIRKGLPSLKVRNEINAQVASKYVGLIA